MNALSSLLSVAAVAVIVAGTAAWWMQRRFVAQLMQQLREAEGSRRELAEQLQALRGRLQSVPVLDDVAARKAALERALDPAPPAAEFPWLETLPAVEHADSKQFAPTLPAGLDLDLEERPTR